MINKDIVCPYCGFKGFDKTRIFIGEGRYKDNDNIECNQCHKEFNVRIDMFYETNAI